MKKTFWLAVMLMGIINFQMAAQKKGQPAPQPVFNDVDIPFQKFVLDNGLTVIIHEDHKAPVVAVNIWYHVGSKNEKVGRTGFAHLFEHLMFNGSEHYAEDYFQALERIGATDLNGTTSEDRTNYFETVPVSALDQVLWLESDRMGYMVNAITQEKLDEQRGVVQNEKRQYENEPFGQVDEYITRSVFPQGHPYSWTVIGSMDDLTAASLDDVKNWFATYYGPNNATLVIAGDVSTTEALEKAKKYFGALKSGPPVVRYQSWPAKRTGTQRQVMQDRVPQERIYMVWNVPQMGTPEYAALDLASDVLAMGKNSRLYKRLVYDEQIATSVYCYLDAREIGSLFYIMADAKPGVPLAKVESAIREELDKFLTSGTNDSELTRVKTNAYAGFVKGLERVGGFGGKSDILANNQTYFGDPSYYKTIMQMRNQTGATAVHTTAKQWLSDGVYVLEVHPYPELTNAAQDADRTTMPVLGESPSLTFPQFERTTLANGLNVILARRTTIPAVDITLSFNAGYASDQLSKPGTAKLAMNMMDEGTKNLTSLQISEKIDAMGASLHSGSNLDQSFVTLNALTQNLNDALTIFADVVLNPSFPQSDFDRLKNEQLVSIQREKSQPNGIALRLLPQFLFGQSHAYSLPLTGSGYETSVSALTREDMVGFHRTWIKPNNATLIVVGDITMDALKPQLDKLFHSWGSGDVPATPIATVSQERKPTIYLMDRPGSIQSLILAGNLTSAYGSLNEAALNTMNNIIGGDFTSRINMNIREDKHWSYGAGSFIYPTAGQRPFLMFTSVQSDKTKESISEINRELTEFRTTRPALEEEFLKTQGNQLLQIPGQYETSSSVNWAINDIVRFKLKDSYFTDYANALKQMKLTDIHGVAQQVIAPSQMVWIVVGDRSQIETPLKSLGYDLVFIDTDGNVVQ